MKLLHLPRAKALIALTVAFAAVAGIVWGNRGSGHAKIAAGQFVRAERGDVAITVGGVGHVSTLTGAARVSVGAAGSTSPVGSSSAATAPAGGGSGASQAPADAVFPSLVGHVVKVLVHAGDQVLAGQPLATISDDGTMATTLLQARSDAATARLELAQKQVQDPLRGPPPTPAELAAGRQAVLAARAKLARTIGPPLAGDLATARTDLAKANADLAAAQVNNPEAVNAAQLAVDTAQRKLEVLSGRPDPSDEAATRLELAKASLDQELLLGPAPAPGPAAIAAADAAIDLALRHQADAAAGTATDQAAANAELAKARADREALFQAPPPPTAAARAAAQLAVDAAQAKLQAVLRPPAATVTAARAELAKAQADLATQRATHGTAASGALQAAVTAARRKLDALAGSPPQYIVSGARLDVRKARSDLAVLLQRGAPANATELALARLKVNVARQRVDLAQQLSRRLTVVAAGSGTVTSVLTTRGAAVDPATPIARVQDLDHLVVALDLSEFDVGRTRVAAPALVSADALGGKEFGGRVLDVALTGADVGGVVNFPVIIALHSGGKLRPGMSVSARIIVRRHRDVVRVPLAAIVDGAVTVRGATGKLRRRQVRLGLRGAEFVEVVSGLRPDERVLVPTGGA